MAADSIWFDVFPSLAKFGPALTKGTNQAAQDAGKTAGATWSRQFSSSAGDGGSKAVVAELESAAKQIEKTVAEQTGKIQAARAAERDAAARTVLAEQSLADARTKNGDSSAQARAAELRLEAARDRQARASGNSERAEESLRAAKREAREVTEQLEQATKDLSSEVQDQPSIWGRFGGALSGIKGDASGADASIGDLVTTLGAAVGAAATFGAAWANNVDLDAGTANVAASLGLTPAQSEAAGAAAGALYAGAYGESMTEVTGAVESVMSSISGLRDASASDLEAVTASALNVASAFDLDVSEAATAAGTLISNGLAPDATGAFDLITASLQKVPEALRGDALDAITEYGGVFSGLGLDGSTAMGMLVAASDGGAIAIDKVGDSLKEFTIRATDMSAATTSAYDTLGLDTEQMTADLLAGGDTASGAMQTIVDALLSVEDPATQANTAIALFGTPLEDLNVTEIPSFLTGLSEMDTSLGDVTGTAAAMGDTLNTNVATSWDSVKRGVLDLVSDGMQPFLDVAGPVLQWAQDTPGVFEAVAISLGVLATAAGIYTAVQWAMNTALLANPLTWVVVGVAALAAGIVLLVQNWGTVSDWLKEKWEPIGDWFVGLWDGIKSGVASVVDWFVGVGAWFGGVWDTVRAGLSAFGDFFVGVWDGIRSGVDTVVGFFTDHVLPVWSVIWDLMTVPARLLWLGLQGLWENVGRPVFEAVQAGAAAMWNFVRDSVFTPLRQGFEVIGQALVWVKDNVLLPVWAGVQAGAEMMWNFVRDSVFTPLRQGFELIGDAVVWVKDNVLAPAWDGVKSLLRAGWTWINDQVFDPFKAGLDLIGDAFDATQQFISTAWGKVEAAAAKPVNFIIETVYNNGIRATWNSIAEAVGLADSLSLPAAKKIAFADGGVMPGYTPRRDVHQFWSPTGGALALSGGEAFMVPEWTRAVGGPGAVARMNADARAGRPVQAFADGGVFGSVGSWISNAAGNVAAIAGQIAQFLADPVAGVRNLVAAPMEALLADVAGGRFGELLVELPRTVVAGIVDAAKALFADAPARTLSALSGSVGPWSSPSAGPITSRYGPRWGAFHAGADVAGGGRTHAAASGRVSRVGWNVLDGRTGVGIVLEHPDNFWTYYGHNPVGGPKVAAGQMVMVGDHIGYQGATGNVTGTHVHFEVHKGRLGQTLDPEGFLNQQGTRLGAAPRGTLNPGTAPKLFDTGGRLEPGLNVIENRLGTSELVLNPDQEGALAAELRAGRRAQRALHIHTTEPITVGKLLREERRADLIAGLEDEG